MATPPQNRIDPTPLRISNNVSIQRQTPKTDFGDRVKSGLDAAGGVVANGAAVVGGIIPGGAIVSAAVNQVRGMTNNVTPTSGGGSGIVGFGGGSAGGGGAVSSSYGATGVVTLGTTTGTGSTSTSTGTGSTSSLTSSTGSSMLGDMNQQLIQSQSENAEMMALQNQMQHENVVFTSVSNVLKTRHDTAKNSIGNVH
jgi:hypothetical protein